MLTAPSLIYDSKRATLPISYLKAKQWRWGVGSREGMTLWILAYQDSQYIFSFSSRIYMDLDNFQYYYFILQYYILYNDGMGHLSVNAFFNDHTNKNSLWVVI